MNSTTSVGFLITIDMKDNIITLGNLEITKVRHNAVPYRDSVIKKLGDGWRLPDYNECKYIYWFSTIGINIFKKCGVTSRYIWMSGILSPKDDERSPLFCTMTGSGDVDDMNSVINAYILVRNI